MVRLAFLRHQDWQADRRDRAGKLWVDSEMVFTTSIGTPVDQTNNLKKFKSFILEKGLRYIRVHDLRHSSAVMALEAGASIESISQALGHSGIEITKTVYAPYVQALNDRFVTALDEYLN
jgi:integrase